MAEEHGRHSEAGADPVVVAQVQKDMDKTYPAREVVPQMRVRVVDCSGVGRVTASITVKNCTDDMAALLEEGKRFRVYSLRATATHGSLLSVASARWMPCALPVPDGRYFPRAVAPLSSLQATPGGAEVDVVGVVLNVSAPCSVMWQSGPVSKIVVFVGDAEGSVAIVEMFGRLDVLRELRVNEPVAVLNALLQRWDNAVTAPVLRVGEQAVISAAPRAPHAREAVESLSRQFHRYAANVLRGNGTQWLQGWEQAGGCAGEGGLYPLDS